jgi:hypothetical protein
MLLRLLFLVFFSFGVQVPVKQHQTQNHICHHKSIDKCIVENATKVNFGHINAKARI